MADIATLEEGLQAAENGADIIGTTLYGYTDETKGNTAFNWSLLAELIRQTNRPIIAEGHLSTPEDARRVIQNGAWSVVVGSAITRPGEITARYVKAIGVPRAMAGPVIGVDIGGTAIKAGVVDRDGKVSSVLRIPTRPSGGREGIAAAATEVIQHRDRRQRP